MKLSRTAGSIILIVVASLFVAGVTAAWPMTALAQCPLCRTAVEQAGDQTARTINLAIVVLLIPPVSIFCAIFAVAYKKSKGDEDQNREPRPARRYN